MAHGGALYGGDVHGLAAGDLIQAAGGPARGLAARGEDGREGGRPLQHGARPGEVALRREGQQLPRVQPQRAGRGAEGRLLMHAQRLARGQLLLRVELLRAVYAGGTFGKVHVLPS